MNEIDVNKENMLFGCMHIDDLKAYKMMREGIEITPQNAPLSNHKLGIIKNTESPYAFSSLSDNNGKWEYMGLGHSGACSLITALLKQLQQLKQENEELKKQYNRYACDTYNGKEDYRNMKRHCETAIKSLHKAEQKLKKIKEYCNKTFHDGVWNGFLMDEEHRVNILQIIEEQ